MGWGTNDIGNVRVLNLYRGAGYTTYAQDMLTVTSVPEPGVVLMMGLGLGMAFHAGARRRVRTCRAGVSGS
jgi:PEP-CTERM motif